MSAGITKIGGAICAAQMSCPVIFVEQPTADSGKDALGTSHTTVFPGKYSLSPTWPSQIKADRATLMGLIYAGNTQAISIEFVSPKTNTTLTKTFRLTSAGANTALPAGIDLCDPFSAEFMEN